MFTTIAEAWTDLCQSSHLDTELNADQLSICRSMFLAGVVSTYKVIQRGKDPFEEIDAAIKELAALKGQ